MSSITNGSVPPTIPGSSLYKTLQVDTAKITRVVGEVISEFSGYKGTVVAATTASITLTAAQTIDGIAVVAGDLVLVKNQSTTSQNGIYICSNSAWIRAEVLPVGSSAAGIMVYVPQGTANGGRVFVCTNAPGSDIVATDGLTFVVFRTLLNSAKSGTVTLALGTAVVNTVVSLATGDRVFVSRKSKGSSSAIGELQALISSTGGPSSAAFTITSLNTTDATTLTTDLSVVDWFVVNSSSFA